MVEWNSHLETVAFFKNILPKTVVACHQFVTVQFAFAEVKTQTSPY